LQTIDRKIDCVGSHKRADIGKRSQEKNLSTHSLAKFGEICLQQPLPISGKPTITKYLKQNDFGYQIHVAVENNLKVKDIINYFKRKRNLPPNKRLGVCVESNTLPTRGVTRLDGTRGNKQVWRPRVRT